MNSKIKNKKRNSCNLCISINACTAGYWNYLSRETQTLATMNSEENSTNENLGDATLVSNNELIQDENEKQAEKENENSENENKEKTEENNKNNNDGYFQESKLSRDTMYSQTLETYQTMLNNSNVSEEQKAIVTQEITKLNKEKNAIMICENLISNKGFSDCVIFVNIDSISIIIKAEQLKTDEIAQIQNIISREMNSKVENIHIMTRK